METYQGYKTMRIKFSECSTEISEIFIKPHSVREYNMKKPGGRTLFIINIPSYVTKDSIRSMMKKFGQVVNVFLHKKPNSKAPPDIKYALLDPEILTKGYKVAYVVFSNTNSIKKAMSMPTEHLLMASSNRFPIVTGLKKWQEDYNSSFHFESNLRKEVEQVMKDYDERKAAEKGNEANEPDEDGWITVTSSLKRKKLAPEKKDKNGLSRKRRKRKPQLNNFYAFQRKEVNMKHLEEKRKKFEEDGRRMALLRSSRKFKPL